MAVLVVGLVLLLALAGHSEAAYCVCNTGLSTSVLQKNIDYACGAGADCSAILQNGACFNPNTVADHCNYAVNSYYQRRGQAPGTCDFAGTATISQTAPPSATSGCVYQSSPSNVGSIAPPTTATPTIGGTPNIGGGTTIPNTGGTNTGTMPGTTTSPGGTGVIGIAPSGSGFGSTDNSASAKFHSLSSTFLLISCFLTTLFVFKCPRI